MQEEHAEFIRKSYDCGLTESEEDTLSSFDKDQDYLDALDDSISIADAQ